MTQPIKVDHRWQIRRVRHSECWYHTDCSPSYAGELRVPLAGLRRLPFDHRKIIARRAAMELVPGAICNLGAGISTGISAIAAEEGVPDLIVLTNEQGFIGGAPLTGRFRDGAEL